MALVLSVCFVISKAVQIEFIGGCEAGFIIIIILFDCEWKRVETAQYVRMDVLRRRDL